MKRLNSTNDSCWCMIPGIRAADLVCTGKLVPHLSTNQVKPTHTFAEKFTGTFCHNKVHIYCSRGGSHHRCTIVDNIGCIILIRKFPPACPCTEHIEQFPCAFT